MFYFILIICGLITALATFVQLYNETRAQKDQIRRLFGNVYVEISCIGDKDNDPQTEPLLSTSTTFGRKGNKNSNFQVDMPIYTTDDSLAENAGEFSIESYEHESRLFIRPLDQKVIWFGDPSKEAKSKVICIAASEDIPEVLTPPAVFGEKEAVGKTAGFRSLRIGDIIVMGNTKFEIKCDDTEEM